MLIVLPPFNDLRSSNDVILAELGISLANAVGSDVLYISKPDEESINKIESVFRREKGSIIVVTKPLTDVSIMTVINDISYLTKRRYSILVRK